MQPGFVRLGVYSMSKTDPPEWKMPEVPGEPEGWRELQEKAQQETDPKKLAAIIDEMNKLLTEQEERARRRKNGPVARSTVFSNLNRTSLRYLQ